VDAVAKLRQQNQDLQAELRQMRVLLQERQALPLQMPSRDLVCVNDALGETYSFPLTFVDSLEVCEYLFWCTKITATDWKEYSVFYDNFET
jgi:hypothetical protein